MVAPLTTSAPFDTNETDVVSVLSPGRKAPRWVAPSGVGTGGTKHHKHRTDNDDRRPLERGWIGTS